MNISSIDLNLLVVFDALLAEGSVTRAAARVGMSQPAFSNALGRLRAEVGDHLFVRTARGMNPTARAMEMAEPVRAALRELRRAFDRPTVDISRTASSITLGLSDYLQAALLPRLLRRLAHGAPALELGVRQLPHRNLVPMLSAGGLDIALDWFEDSPTQNSTIESLVVFSDPYCCVVRNNHPALGAGLTLESLAGLKHVRISPFDEPSLSLIDAAFARVAVPRRIGVTISNLLAAPWVVAQSDLLAILPVRMARWFVHALPLSVCEPPFDLPPSIVCVRWHYRNAGNPAVIWLREQLLDIGRDMDQRANV